MTEQEPELTDLVHQALAEMLQQAQEKGRLQGYANGWSDAVAHAKHHMSQMPSQAPNGASIYDPQVQEASATLPLSTNVEDLQLTVRTYNCLKREGMHNFRDIMQFAQKSNFADIRNFGARSFDEMKASLAERGYVFDPSWPGFRFGQVS